MLVRQSRVRTLVILFGSIPNHLISKKQTKSHHVSEEEGASHPEFPNEIFQGLPGAR
uniref:Uncharacterized protein n=1 Tax=Anguilla anguilla TaxID=7936 RepID=A0A0E9XG12_ANGAN